MRAFKDLDAKGGIESGGCEDPRSSPGTVKRLSTDRPSQRPSYLPSGSVRRLTKAISDAGASSRVRVRATFWSIPDLWLLPALAVLVLAVLAAVVLPVVFSYIDQGSASSSMAAFPANLTLANVDAFHGLVVVAKIVTINPQDYTATLAVEIIPSGEYTRRGSYGVMDLPAGRLLVVLFGRNSVTLAAGAALGSTQVVMPLAEEVPYPRFPFDRYNIHAPLRAWMIDDISQGGTSWDSSNHSASVFDTATPFGLNTLIYAVAPGWSVSCDLKPETPPALDEDGGAWHWMSLDIHMKRAPSTYFFSSFIFVLMWALSLAMLVITLVSLWVAREEVGYDAPALAVGLLFALPSVRAVAPDIPPLGCLFDVGGFFFNMVIIALSTVLLLCAIVKQQRAGMAARKSEKQAQLALDARVSSVCGVAPAAPAYSTSGGALLAGSVASRDPLDHLLPRSPTQGGAANPPPSSKQLQMQTANGSPAMFNLSAVATVSGPGLAAARASESAPATPYGTVGTTSGLSGPASGAVGVQCSGGTCCDGGDTGCGAGAKQRVAPEVHRLAAASSADLRGDR